MKFWQVIIVGLATPVLAQNVPPFFGGGVVAYDPQPAVINSGQLLDTTANVSADEKYVTISTQVTQQRLRSLTNFPVVQGPVTPQGFVGGVVFPNVTSPNASPTRPPKTSPIPAAPSPQKIEQTASSWILTRQGMYLITPLK